MSATPQDLAINSAVAAEPMDNLIQTSFWRDARLAWRLLTREWHSGELRVLVAALLVAVAGITASPELLARDHQLGNAGRVWDDLAERSGAVPVCRNSRRSH